MRSVEWLAGLLEGEGCFANQRSGSSGLYHTPVVAIAMTDFDVIDAARIEFERIGNRTIKIGRRPLRSGKIAFDARVTGLPAARIMLAVLPHLGVRRTAKVREILAAWKPVKYREAAAFRATLERGDANVGVQS